MEKLESLLTELIELQKASIRLQKFAIVLAAENSVYQQAAVMVDEKSQKAISKTVVKAVQQMRATVDKIEQGKKLPK
ncbi:MAG: hypothetical protein K1X91_15725 [Bacteriodetes bacterium]|nr:hypothetical protein [Bacteroidota bacterium]